LIRWTISSTLRELLIRLARQQGDTLRAIATVWGVSVERIRQLTLTPPRRRLMARSQLAWPIDIDNPCDRKRWHEFALGDLECQEADA
jgi:hypothetical protein